MAKEGSLNTPVEKSDANLSIEDINTQFSILKAANHIAHLLSRTIPLDQAIEPLISEFMDLVHAECGSIQLLRPGSQQTQRTLVRKCTHGQCGFDTNLENLVTGWILTHHSSLITDDIAAQIKLGTAAKRYAEISSFIAVPIRCQENIIGVISLIRVRPSPSFSSQNAQLASSLAQEIAEFIEQAHWREQFFSDYQKLRQEVTDRYSLHGRT